jgi:aminoglycoside 6'-N-acetyltransferase I
VNVRELQSTDREAWLAMRSALWPHCTSERHVSEMHAYFSGGGPLATFVAEETDGVLRGFIEASMRPCAEGCTTKPVAYIEGIYVAAAFRRRGIARRLVAAVERWAASRGCVEFASDCLHDNEASIRFHLSLGFDIAKQLIHFRSVIPNSDRDV